ncbi:MAG: hypothetical protein JSU68_08285 [Phycisphaerales bacterium]|nr:MAG: hypothetical protein JSU68_08285 [Phycisphaerales bacterium]
MSRELFRDMGTLVLAMVLSGMAAGQQVGPAPEPASTPERKALEEIYDDLKQVWASGRLTFEQKIDLGRLIEQIEAAGEGGNRSLPMPVIEAKRALLDQIVPPAMLRELRQTAERNRAAALKATLLTFSMKWPEDLRAKWEQAYEGAWAGLEAELAERRAMQADVYAEVKANPSKYGRPEEAGSERIRRNVVSRPANIELYIRQLEFTPYYGKSFDDKVLADAALNDEQRHELGTFILARALHRRAGARALSAMLPALELSPEGLARLRSGFDAAEAEIKSAIAAKIIEITDVGTLQQLFYDTVARESGLDTLLSDRQKKLLEVAERARADRLKIRFELGELEPELVLEIGEVLDRFDAQTEGIPRNRGYRSMVYQEAGVDRKLDAFRVAMRSKKLSTRRKGEIVEASLDTLFPELYRAFSPFTKMILDSWPVSFPGVLPQGCRTPESLTPERWYQLYEVMARPEIWEALKDAQLTACARLLAQQATDGRAVEMQILSQYKINRSTYMFCEGVFEDPRFTPLQKLLIFESAWNQAGPFAAFYYSLDLDADYMYARMTEMRRMLVFASSYAPPNQLIFSVSDIAERQKASLRSVWRWTEIGGLFDEEEMKVLKARYDQLMARLEEWGRYEPLDPNKPKATPTATQPAAETG